MTQPAPATLEIDEKVAIITLQAPPANALKLAMVEALDPVLDTVEGAGARVLILRSDAPGFFVAGADLKLIGDAHSAAFDVYLTRLRATIERIASMPVITIAAIDGYALGGGLELALACTFRVGGPGAKLGVPEIKLGLLPGAGGTVRLPQLIGRGPALDLLLTGRTVGAAEGLALHLLDRFGADGADAEARRLAATLATMPIAAMTAIVRCVEAARDETRVAAMKVEGSEILGLFGGPDAREGLAAFLEKRPANFG